MSTVDSSTSSKPPCGYRLRRVGEIRCATDKVFTFNFDEDREGKSWGWQSPDSFDRGLVGRPIHNVGIGFAPWAAKIVKRKAPKRRKKK